MAENKSYSHTDIQRYLQEQMSRREMHAFEKTLMNDPFLSDALDGYRKANADLAKEHLSAIEVAINKEKPEARVLPIHSTKASWWKVAAIVLIVVTGGMLSYSLFKKTSTSTETNPLVVNKTQTPVPRTDTIKEDEKSLADVNINSTPDKVKKAPSGILANREMPVARLDKSPINENTVTEQKDMIVLSPAKTMEYKQIPSAEAAPMSKQEGVANNLPPQNELKGRVSSDKGEPIAGASLRVPGKNIAASTDNAGKFSIKSSDTVLKVDVNTKGYASANVRISSDDASKQIKLQENTPALNEVAVAERSFRKKTVDGGTKLSLKSVAEPIISWNNYRQYLKEQVDSILLADKKQRAKLAVNVEFEINKSGEPVKVKTVNDADKYYSEKAIYMIVHGCKWNKKNSSEKGKVQIEF